MLVAPVGTADRVKDILALLTERTFHLNNDLSRGRLICIYFSFLFGGLAIGKQRFARSLVILLHFAVDLVILVHRLQMVFDFNLVKDVRVLAAILAHVDKLFETRRKVLLAITVVLHPGKNVKRGWNGRRKPVGRLGLLVLLLLETRFFVLDVLVDLIEVQRVLMLINLQVLTNFRRDT